MHMYSNSHAFECITKVTCIIRMKVNVHKNIMFGVDAGIIFDRHFRGKMSRRVIVSVVWKYDKANVGGVEV